MHRSDYTFLADRMAGKSRSDFELLKPCPLCSAMLRRGETVHTVAFSGGGKKDGQRQKGGRPSDYLVHIFGCPYCYPDNNAHRRICPVCSKELNKEDFLIARMFEKQKETRKHVHVLGCTRCRERKNAP
jgi:hypothetical protein